MGRQLQKGQSSADWKGVLIYRGADSQPNREIPIEGESEEAGMGQCTIGGKTYDLAKGALFLVSGIDGGLHVNQQSRDMNKLTFDPSELAAFGQSDAEITAFFSKPAKAKLFRYDRWGDLVSPESLVSLAGCGARRRTSR